MRTINNIIFDFDGTLVDTAPLIIRTMQGAIKELGLPEKTEEECRATIGIRLEDVPAAIWPGCRQAIADYAKTYRRIFDELKRPLNVECFPEVTETLRRLHDDGYRMAIASSRSRKSLEEYVELFGLSDCFEILIGGNDVKEGKPSPEPVLTILDRLNWRPEETLVVGDASVDILMGKRAGCHTCGVTYGNGKPMELAEAGAHSLIDSFSQITTCLQ